jgi:hypothetical protein
LEGIFLKVKFTIPVEALKHPGVIFHIPTDGKLMLLVLAGGALMMASLCPSVSNNEPAKYMQADVNVERQCKM